MYNKSVLTRRRKMKVANILTIKEQATRKRWLFCTILGFVGVPLILAIILNACNLEWSTSIFIAFMGIVPAAIMWKYSYKKNCDNFLIGWMIFGAFINVYRISLLIKGEQDGFEIAGWAFDLGLYIWWYIESFSLLKINKKRKKESNQTSIGV
jgi:hypothetical protein